MEKKNKGRGKAPKLPAKGETFFLRYEGPPALKGMAVRGLKRSLTIGKQGVHVSRGVAEKAIATLEGHTHLPYSAINIMLEQPQAKVVNTTTKRKPRKQAKAASSEKAE